MDYDQTSPFMKAVEALQKDDWKSWACRVTAAGVLVNISVGELNQRFGPMTDGQAQAIRTEITERLTIAFQHALNSNNKRQ